MNIVLGATAVVLSGAVLVLVLVLSIAVLVLGVHLSIRGAFRYGNGQQKTVNPQAGRGQRLVRCSAIRVGVRVPAGA